MFLTSSTQLTVLCRQVPTNRKIYSKYDMETINCDIRSLYHKVLIVRPMWLKI